MNHAYAQHRRDHAGGRVTAAPRGTRKDPLQATAGFTAIEGVSPERTREVCWRAKRWKGQARRVKNNNNEALLCELLNQSPRRVFRQQGSLNDRRTPRNATRKHAQESASVIAVSTATTARHDAVNDAFRLTMAAAPGVPGNMPVQYYAAYGALDERRQWGTSGKTWRPLGVS